LSYSAKKKRSGIGDLTAVLLVDCAGWTAYQIGSLGDAYFIALIKDSTKYLHG